MELAGTEHLTIHANSDLGEITEFRIAQLGSVGWDRGQQPSPSIKERRQRNSARAKCRLPVAGPEFVLLRPLRPCRYIVDCHRELTRRGCVQKLGLFSRHKAQAFTVFNGLLPPRDILMRVSLYQRM
jgi:hypothetical protein